MSSPFESRFSLIPSDLLWRRSRSSSSTPRPNSGMLSICAVFSSPLFGKSTMNCRMLDATRRYIQKQLQHSLNQSAHTGLWSVKIPYSTAAPIANIHSFLSIVLLARNTLGRFPLLQRTKMQSSSSSLDSYESEYILRLLDASMLLCCDRR